MEGGLAGSGRVGSRPTALRQTVQGQAGLLSSLVTYQVKAAASRLKESGFVGGVGRLFLVLRPVFEQYSRQRTQEKNTALHCHGPGVILHLWGTRNALALSFH